jgi:hypothetical protein
MVTDDVTIAKRALLTTDAVLTHDCTTQGHVRRVDWTNYPQYRTVCQVCEIPLR